MRDYERVARIIRHLDEHHATQPDLAELARRAELSPHHFHRLFARWAGVTPKAFLRCLTLAHAKERLRAGASVLDAALDGGLSGPGRLHDLSVALEAASPGERKAGGAGWTLRAGFAESPFGTCLLAESPRGICHLSFVEDRAAALDALAGDWPAAGVVRDDARAARSAAAVFRRPGEPRPPLRAFVRGSAFQVRVWRALLRVPPGARIGYAQLAAAAAAPAAARAAGAAAGGNPLAYLIPCHRVIRSTGVLGGYRWGGERKRAMLAWEDASVEAAPCGTRAAPRLV